MQESTRENAPLQLVGAPVLYDSDCAREKLHDSFGLNPLIETEAAEYDQGDLTVAKAAKLLGRSARTVQRMLLNGQLHGYKVPGPKGPEWRVASVDDLHTATELRASGAAKIAELEARVASLEERLSIVMSDQHTARVRADHTERKCYEIVHEHDRTIQNLNTEVRRALKDQTESVRRASDELQAIKKRLNSQHLMLSDAQLSVIGDQLRIWFESNRRSWWQAICSSFQK